MKETNYADLTEIQRKLVDSAYFATEDAYSPYSNFKVGAALLTSSDRIITGANVENSAYPDSICAERAAILRANAMGFRVYKSIAVVAKVGDEPTKQITAPCGSCRQVIYEFSQIAGSDIEIILSTSEPDKTENRIIITSINELLPEGFGPSDLGIDVTKFRK
ncbi:MAG: cytidine deaminase [Candidatus Aenigmarchaeota archaeon]|nr:cytidine deaminase [Candidatus Aenigmarchaeota archaeon]